MSALATCDHAVVEAHDVDTSDEQSDDHRVQPYGKFVEITHDSNFSGFVSSNGHLTTVTVKKGGIVKRG